MSRDEICLALDMHIMHSRRPAYVGRTLQERIGPGTLAAMPVSATGLVRRGGLGPPWGQTRLFGGANPVQPRRP